MSPKWYKDVQDATTSKDKYNKGQSSLHWAMRDRRSGLEAHLVKMPSGNASSWVPLAE